MKSDKIEFAMMLIALVVVILGVFFAATYGFDKTYENRCTVWDSCDSQVK